MDYSTQPPEYFIERLGTHNLGDVDRLHAIVYGKKAAPGYFKKKYDTAYTGVQYVGYLAYDGDREPLAFYAVIPCFLKYDERLVLAAQSADTMTNPNFRFKGLFVELSNLTFKLCRQEGIFIVFGFPNQNSYHGAVNKLSWQLTETLHYFSIPAARFSLEGLAAKHPLLTKLYKRYTARILQKYLLPQNGIANSLIAEGFAGVDRSEAYLAYKTYSPTMVIRLRKATVWCKINNGLTVGDILLDTSDIDLVIAELKKLARKLGSKQIVFQASPASRLYALLSVTHQPKPSFPVLFQNFDSGLDLDSIKFTFADIDIF